MKITFIILGIILLTNCNNSNNSQSQNEDTSATAIISTFEKQLLKSRAEKDEMFKNNAIIPIEKMASFKGLQYFSPDSTYIPNARITFLDNKPILFNTSTKRTPTYYEFCKLDFKLNGKNLSLIAYSSESEASNTKHLFIPFKDSTNGITTYESGRYLELDYNNEKSNFILDFNYAFNPYCHYNHDYSCPLVPANNILTTFINAGEKKLYP